MAEIARDARAAPAAHVRPLSEDDLDAADRIMRLAFGTFRGLPDPTTSHGDAQLVRPRFRAAPQLAWAAEVDGVLAGSVFATQWGSFGFFGPLTVDPAYWDRGVGSALMAPVLDSLERWELRQAGLFTFPNSPKHLGLYQKSGFWPRFPTVVMERPSARAGVDPTTFSAAPAGGREELLSELRRLTDDVFPGLDLEREVTAVREQGLGDTVLLYGDGGLAGMAVCHCGAGSEADSDACYVKFGAVLPGDGAADRLGELLDACGSFAALSGARRLVAGVNTGRLGAYRRMLASGFRTELIGLSMVLRPDGPTLDTPEHYVIDDLR